MSSPYRDQPRSEPLAGYEQPREVCRHIAIDAWRCPDCGESVRASVADLRDRLATAEAVAVEAREEKRTWVEAAGKELDAQRREIERLLTERDEAQRKLAVAVDALDSAHNALDQATYRSVVGADVGTEALNAVRDAIARVRSMT